MAGPTYGTNPPDDRLEFGIVTGQHLLGWSAIDELWQWADESGLDSAWVIDHLTRSGDGGSNPCLEGWTLLSALVSRTRSVQAGILVSPVTFRHPVVLAKQAVSVDVISGGRLILGVGAGSDEWEHRAYGIPYPSAAERVERFGEALTVYRLLERQERTTFQGRYYRLEDAPFAPKPVHGRIPILVGSRGARMMRHIARHADLWNGDGSPETCQAHSERLSATCLEIGRDPKEIRRVLMSKPWLYADPLASEDAFRQYVAGYAAIGIRSFMLFVMAANPTPVMQAIAERVIPDVRASFAAGTLVS